jgi:arylsulfatase A-like enzyme
MSRASWKTPVVIVAVVASAALVGLGLLARRETGPALRLPGGGLPNILLVTIDTLRGDHVGYDGRWPHGLTPELDRLAQQGTAFLSTTTPAPATRPATASLFTGAYPGTHGVTNNSGRLSPPTPVLAEILRGAGYQTASIYGNLTIGPKQGFHRGFDSSRDFVVQRKGSKDALGVELAEQWLAAEPKSPWLLWLHLMDPHGPYNSAPPETLAQIDTEDPLPERVLTRAASNFGLGVLPRYQRIPGVRRASAYRRRYRADVRTSDAQLGNLLRALDRLGLADSTLVIVTADHGEALGEHDYYFQHGWFLHEGSVHVPLLFRLPGRVLAGVQHEESVSLIDVMPTLLGGLGLERPVTLEGRDLSGALVNGELEDAPAFAVSVADNQVSSVRVGDWKLIHTPRPPPPELRGGAWGPYFQAKEGFALFDLARDPGETKDVSTEEPERFAKLKGLLAEWERTHGVPRGGGRDDTIGEGDVDPRLREELKALGYVD